MCQGTSLLWGSRLAGFLGALCESDQNVRPLERVGAVYEQG